LIDICVGVILKPVYKNKKEEERIAKIAEAVRSIQNKDDEVAENDVPLSSSTTDVLKETKQLLPIPQYPDVEPDNPSLASDETPAPLEIGCLLVISW